MPVTVYIWDSHGMEAVGHASMSLSDGTHISWWPQGEDRKSLPTGHAKRAKAIQPQTLDDDIAGEDGRRPKSILVSGLDERAIRKWWTDFKRKETMWSLLDQNCSTVVYNALCAGDAESRLPVATKMVYRACPVWFPAAVEAFVKDLNSMATAHQTTMDPQGLSSWLASFTPTTF